jgi:hypothetical protein
MARKPPQPPFNPNPELAMGRHPDGSPWLIGANFGANVTIDAYGRIYVDRKEIDVDDAYERAQAMLAAVEWIRSGRTAQVEAAKGQS